MSVFDNINEDINNFFKEATNFINKQKEYKMDKTNKTFAEFAVKNGWKRTEAGKDGTVVYYGNMGILITKDYQLKPVFVLGDTYIDIGLNSYIYGEYARDIVNFTKNEANND